MYKLPSPLHFVDDSQTLSFDKKEGMASTVEGQKIEDTSSDVGQLCWGWESKNFLNAVLTSQHTPFSGVNLRS